MVSDSLISVLCFSKDRPLQLEAYLDSLFRFSAEPLQVSVLYSCGPIFRTAYDKLKSYFPHVNFIRETDFKTQVLNYLEQVKSPFFMFGCDDVIFKRPWRPEEICKLFRDFRGLFGFSLRLGKEISWQQVLNRNMSKPNFLETNPFLVWRWPIARGVDWSYPWELTCTIYPTQLVRAMLTIMKKLDWGHPNRLEGLGAYLAKPTMGLEWMAHYIPVRANVLTKSSRRILIPISFLSFLFFLPRVFCLTRGLDFMASYPSARASVVTINRVQDVVLDPIYDSGLTVDLLLEKWNKGTILDIDAYKGRSYPSMHIGDVHFCSRLKK